MTKIPTRLVVIQARIPTGESCEGCEFLSVSERLSKHQELRPWACGLHEITDRSWTLRALPPDRLPACRERDGWTAVRGDALEELHGRLLDLDHYAAEYRAAHKTSRPEWHCEAENNLANAHKEAIGAARKVAEVAK